MTSAVPVLLILAIANQINIFPFLALTLFIKNSVVERDLENSR